MFFKCQLCDPVLRHFLFPFLFFPSFSNNGVQRIPPMSTDWNSIVRMRSHERGCQWKRKWTWVGLQGISVLQNFPCPSDHSEDGWVRYYLNTKHLYKSMIQLCDINIHNTYLITSHKTHMCVTLKVSNHRIASYLLTDTEKRRQKKL